MNSDHRDPMQIMMSGDVRVKWQKPALGCYEVNISTEITNCGVGDDSVICTGNVS
ncbi:hypothetical protein P7L74_09850 [Tistrella mobilis]|uniref:hypothetical protein n=1 Tax=Tistrella mobilis TaxID=171437 RepID=UPI0035585BB5